MSSKKIMEDEIDFIDNKSNTSLDGLILIDEEIRGYFI